MLEGEREGGGRSRKDRTAAGAMSISGTVRGRCLVRPGENGDDVKEGRDGFMREESSGLQSSQGVGSGSGLLSRVVTGAGC